jgi:hypothetical protein
METYQITAPPPSSNLPGSIGQHFTEEAQEPAEKKKLNSANAQLGQAIPFFTANSMSHDND